MSEYRRERLRRGVWLWVFIITAGLLIGHGVITGAAMYACAAIAVIVAIT